MKFYGVTILMQPFKKNLKKNFVKRAKNKLALCKISTESDQQFWNYSRLKFEFSKIGKITLSQLQIEQIALDQPFLHGQTYV